MEGISVGSVVGGEVSIAKSKELGRAVERNVKLQVEPKLGGGCERKGWWGREERG